MNETPSSPSSKPTDSLSALDLLKTNFFLEAGRIDQRTDWFLIFHAILFEAFVASLRLSHRPGLLYESIPGLPIGLLGVISSLYWFATGCRTFWLLRQLGGYLGDECVTGTRFSAVWQIVYEGRRRHAFLQWARPAPMFLILLPAVVMLVWSIITFFTFDRWQQLSISGITIGVVIWISIGFGRQQDKRPIPPDLDDMRKAVSGESSGDGAGARGVSL
jgi:hypothetical protein